MKPKKKHNENQKIYSWALISLGICLEKIAIEYCTQYIPVHQQFHQAAQTQRLYDVTWAANTTISDHRHIVAACYLGLSYHVWKHVLHAELISGMTFGWLTMSTDSLIGTF